ncbi:glycerol dehydrogenase [Phanerochaete sordida]|uniref:Glycerol dehydrogenase n=1 Tax=Phanerochaete sordida TaxID=48140 RepID=A0A9P3G2A6_9APHY|nr:glycerol dehydrogenase [Phanerochaete sordida]
MPNPKHITERIFQGPQKYIQGPNAIKNSGQYLKALGKKPLLTVDDNVYEIAGKNLISVLEKNGFTIHRARFRGEASVKEIDRLTVEAKDAQVDFVIALGGGKTIDTSKAIANHLGVPIAVMSTTASTDAPCSALSVLYSEEGLFESYRFYQWNPNLVLVDTSVVINAPPRMLAAGIGDALATNVEARQARYSVNFGGGMPTELAGAVCRTCEGTLFRYGKQAYEANKTRSLTPAFEAVVEANTLLSGLGFETGGIAAAHAIHNGFTAIEAMHGLMHGEKVAFGIVCQLILDGADTAELERYIDLMLSVDLPITFELLGIPKVTDAELRAVAKAACAPTETIWNMERAINEDIVFHAIKGADTASREFIRRTGWRKSA